MWKLLFFLYFFLWREGFYNYEDEFLFVTFRINWLWELMIGYGDYYYFFYFLFFE